MSTPLTDTQKKTLETETFKEIEKLMETSDLAIINLAKFAWSHELFFPEIYEMWYIKNINQAVSKAEIFGNKTSYEAFGLNASQAGIIYSDALHIFKKQLSIKLGNGFKNLEIGEYLKNILKTGVVFKSDFFESNAVGQTLYPDQKEEIKRLSKENESEWLNAILESKSDNRKKVKI